MLSYNQVKIFINAIRNPKMNKKQRNKKLVAQNKRNRIINRRYSSTIKTLAKLFKNALSKYKKEPAGEIKDGLKLDLSIIASKFYSIVDKGVKKKVLHKNKAARKKSNVGKHLSAFY
jgi:small subunit ribosomal protein S20